MAEKLVIQAKNKTSNGLNPVFVSAETHGQIKALAAETGNSIKDLTEAFLQFALANNVVKSSPDGKTPN
ncbi:hypothetical protein [Weissella ceti]|uniref:Uncharacterized protein n=1 Tax=Weissella ceti TaxID=759620 RepID=A0A088GGK7_9LACO|nr:hypothetical protein [Weissella ceti]AIM63111.1 hypothetical protein WS74_0859 [Weissella ceti]